MTLSFRLGRPWRAAKSACYDTEKTILLVDQDQILKNIIPTLIRRPLGCGSNRVTAGLICWFGSEILSRGQDPPFVRHTSIIV